MIGPDCIIESNVRIFGAVQMGSGNRVCHGTVLGCEPEGLAHGKRVAAVKAAGHISLVDVRHDLLIQAHGPATVAFAEVTVEQHLIVLPRALPVGCFANRSPAYNRDCG